MARARTREGHLFKFHQGDKYCNVPDVLAAVCMLLEMAMGSSGCQNNTENSVKTWKWECAQPQKCSFVYFADL